MIRQYSDLLSKRMIQWFYYNDFIKQIPKPPFTVRFFHLIWKSLYGEVIQGDINGIKILFYEPYYGPGPYLFKFLTGRLYEHSVIKHLEDVAKKYVSPTFLDIGAYFGYYTIYMSKLGGSSSRVFSFEPNSKYFKVLSKNVSLNKLQNVVLYKIALSDKEGKAVLEASKRFKSRGLSQEKRMIKKSSIPNHSSEEYVSTISFDKLAISKRISPDIVKIDVHGAEGNVIEGMKRSLKKHVSHLYCELHGEMCNGYTAKDIVENLQDAGMETLEFRGFRTPNGRFTEIPKDLFSLPHDRMIYARK
jgi:FkbM family methyltransferase